MLTFEAVQGMEVAFNSLFSIILIDNKSPPSYDANINILEYA